MPTPTELAKKTVERIWEPEANLTAIIDSVISELVEAFPEGGTLNGRDLAKTVAKLRGPGSDATQTKDYTLFRLREHEHLCRHMIDRETGVYRFHTASECGPECREAWKTEQARQARPVSTCCFVEMTTAGTCPMCE